MKAQDIISIVALGGAIAIAIVQAIMETSAVDSVMYALLGIAAGSQSSRISKLGNRPKPEEKETPKQPATNAGPAESPYT